MNRLDQRDLFQGFGNTLARGFELAATPALFAFIGHLLDRWLGTEPVFLVTLFVLCVIGLGAKSYYGYKVEMEAKEAELFGQRDAR